MTNASSAYLGIVIGAGFAVILSWWLYNRQKKTSSQQNYILQHVRELEEKNAQVLMLREGDQLICSTIPREF
jgi:hypothetical protein